MYRLQSPSTSPTVSVRGTSSPPPMPETKAKVVDPEALRRTRFDGPRDAPRASRAPFGASWNFRGYVMGSKEGASQTPLASPPC